MKKTNRRQFMKSTALSAGALTLPLFSIPRTALGAHHKVNVAVVGAGGLGAPVLLYLAAPDARPPPLMCRCRLS